MKNKLLLVLASAAITFSSNSFANVANDGSDHTVLESLKDLKDSLKDTATASMEKFSDKTSELYNKLSTQVDELAKKAVDKKDDKIDKLKLERDALKAQLDVYSKSNTEDAKTEEMRLGLIQKLEELNTKISDYNKAYLTK